MKRGKKEIIIVFLIIVAIFSLGAYLYKGYKFDKETPVRAKFVQSIYYYIGWGEYY